MRGARLTLIGSIIGVIGVALLLVEAIPAISGDAILSSVDQLLMWIGLGLAAVGGVLLIVDAWTPRTPETD